MSFVTFLYESSLIIRRIKVPEKINYHRGDSDLNLQLLRNRSERVREGNSVFSERRNLHDQFR
jgi:hypothetical protein